MKKNDLSSVLADRKRRVRENRERRTRGAEAARPLDECVAALGNLEQVSPEGEQWWVKAYPERLFEAGRAYAAVFGKHVLDVPALEEEALAVGRAMFEQALEGASVEDLRASAGKAMHSLESNRDTDGLRGCLLFARALRREVLQRKTPRLKPKRRSNPRPAPEALRRAWRKLQKMGPEDRLAAGDVIDLYGLDIGEDAFRRSSMYVGGSPAWSLPRLNSGERARRAGRFAASSWTVAEVTKAVKGWMKRLDLEAPSPF